jgi:transposase
VGILLPTQAQLGNPPRARTIAENVSQKKHTIYLILDNFSPHKHKTVRQWAKKNNIIFVWTPTNASWLNRIECQFIEMKKYSLDNTFFKTHVELQNSIKKFLRYRNTRNKKKKKSLP